MRLVKARAQPCDLAPRRIAMQRALALGLLQRSRGSLELCGAIGSVSAGNSLGRELHGIAHLRFYRVVALGAFKVLAVALLGRRMNWNMRHDPE